MTKCNIGWGFINPKEQLKYIFTVESSDLIIVRPLRTTVLSVT